MKLNYRLCTVYKKKERSSYGIKKLICIAVNGTGAQKAGSIATLYGNADSLIVCFQLHLQLMVTETFSYTGLFNKTDRRLMTGGR